MTSRFRLPVATFIACLLPLLPASAAPPQIARITSPPLQIGAATTIVIEGTDLTPNPRILLPVPIASQTVKEPAAANRVQIEVKLAGNVLPGVSLLRIGNDRGISNPIGIEIDDMAQQPFGPKIDRVPVSLHGTLSGSSTLATALTGKKGQRLVIEAEARRIGSAIEPVLALLDSRRVQLAWAQGNSTLQGDARLTAMLPADGTYIIELHDEQFRAGSPNRFRLKIGDLQTADLAFPLAGRRGSKAAFQLVGSQPERRIEADLTFLPGSAVVPLPLASGLAGLAPRILVSDLPEVLETEPAPGKPQEVAVPVGINARIGKGGEEDRFRLSVQPGMKVRFDVLAERAGSSLDGVLVLRNEAGTQLARSDDQTGTLDPGLEYTVPPGVTSLVAAVTDAHGRGGSHFVYRLAITPSGQPDFTLALVEDRVQIPRNGAAVVRVKATRTGYTGPIKLSLPGLPAGVILAGDDIPAGAGDTLLTLSVKDGVKPLHGVVPQVIGDSTDPKMPLKRLALAVETPLTKVMPWLRGELAIGVTDPGPIGIAWETNITTLKIGAPATVKVKANRSAEAKGPIRLSLMTSQIVPKTKDNRTDDINRALRLEGAPTIPGILSIGDLKILVPADLPALPYDVAIKAEMLAADGRTVLATAFTPARRLTAAR